MNNNILNNDIKQYFKTVKSLFPTFGKLEKKIYNELIFDVNEFIKADSTRNIGDVIDLFGEPNEIISEYLASNDIDSIYGRIRKNKIIINCIRIVSTILVISIVIFSLILIDSLHDARDSFVDREIIKITETTN